MSRIPIGYSVRLAIVRNTFKTQVECMYTDREGEHTVRCAIPHPYAGIGGGIFIGIEVGTRVLISMAPQEQAYIVGIVPERSYYFDQGGILDSPINTTPYPELKSGELCLKGPTGSRLDLTKKGNISLEAGAGSLESDFELSPYSKCLFVRTDNTYKFTEAGREIEGIIKRDKNDEENPENTGTLNFLSGESYDSILTSIGRSPNNVVSLRSSQLSKKTVRNPSLVEKRSITYEYANSFDVRGLDFESSATAMMKKDKVDQVDFDNIAASTSSRENRRTDILDLNPRNFNHLIEKVEGTVVDIYGNVLDINRNIINVPKTNELNTDKSPSSLMRLYSYLRRSIKYHFEINSRKDISDMIPSTENTTNKAKEHSRWSIDVDGEGLTKINIPASSETGNIPVLGRYIVSRDSDLNKIDTGSFKDPGDPKRDIRLLQFNNLDGGQQIVDSDYSPVAVDGSTVSLVGTAHHNIAGIAPSIFNNGKLKSPDPGIITSSISPISENINNHIAPLNGNNYVQNPEANAGGRSISANLDGSIEMSVGADTVDRKSLVLDLAGGVISHYGRDKNGRSQIHQTDGDVIIQIGGPGVSGDERFTDSKNTEDRPGRVEIHLNRPGQSSQKIIIDENGITLDINGNGLIKTSGDLSLSSGGTLLLHGKSVEVCGTVDDDINGTRNVTSSEKLIIRDGRAT